MSSYNSKECKECGCICVGCVHRHTFYSKCETSCTCCSPEMPLDSYDRGEYGGISKCDSYQDAK